MEISAIVGYIALSIRILYLIGIIMHYKPLTGKGHMILDNYPIK